MYKNDYQILTEKRLESSLLISKLALMHFYFSFHEKDRLTNKEIDTLQSDIIQKSPYRNPNLLPVLPYFIDEFENTINYARPAIETIIRNPRSAMVKESFYIHKERLKNMDAKVYRWLGNKPGASIKEKIANLRKIKSFRSIYSYNTKENQLFLHFLNSVESYLSLKLQLITSLPTIFGQEVNHLISTHQEIRNYLHTFHQQYQGVIPRAHVTANNILLNDQFYRVIWRAYKSILSINFADTQSYVNDEYLSGIIGEIIKIRIGQIFGVSIIDYPQKLFSKDNSVLFVIKADRELKVIDLHTQNNNIEINLEIYKPGQQNDQENQQSITAQVRLLAEDYTPDRGRSFQIKLGTKQLNYYADYKGIQIAAELVIDALKLASYQSPQTSNEENATIEQPFLSIYSYDNLLLGSNRQESLLIAATDTKSYRVPLDLVVLEDHLTTAHDLITFDINGTSFIDNTQKFIDANSYLIYDISDVMDEFSSSNLRGGFARATYKSYPVWRSILAGETIGDHSVTGVFDFCGSEAYLCKLGTKNQRFIHLGPESLNVGFNVMSEKVFLEAYLTEYFRKYQLDIPQNHWGKIIKSGQLSKILKEKKFNFAFFSMSRKAPRSIFHLKYDYLVFNKVQDTFITSIKNVLSAYQIYNPIVIIPNFINSSLLSIRNVIQNEKLHLGANNIRNRLLLNEVTWYEKLPNISLEVTRNGIWDIIDLTHNKEEENIIGKSIDITVPDVFLLKQGVNEFHLPLRKSFVGENNIDFEAILKDEAFPLPEDIPVRIRLKYQYGVQNSYRLFFYPEKPNQYFNEIEVLWEKRNLEITQSSLRVINPEIKGIEFTEIQASKVLYYIQKDAYELVNKWSDFVAKQFKDKYVGRVIDRFTNQCHRLFGYSKTYQDKILKDPNVIKLIPLVETYLIEAQKKYQVSDKSSSRYNDSSRIFLIRFSQLLAVITMDLKYLREAFFKVPEATYGRYLGILANNKELVEYVYQFIVQTKTTDFNKRKYPELHKIDTFVDRLTAASAINHLFMKEIHEVSRITAYEISKLLLNCLKITQKGSFMNSAREGAIIMNAIIELLFSFLYLRDKVGMEMFLPSQKLANEIIVSLKEYLRTYYLNLEKNNKQIEKIDENLRLLKEKPEENQYQIRELEVNRKKLTLPSIDIKLRIVMDVKPDELKRVPDVIYALILFLSGDDLAKKIIISVNDDNKSN